MIDADVAIIGGGPVGATLALALQDKGLRLMVLEARPDPMPPADPRVIALSYGSRLILQRLGVWSALAPSVTPIRSIHVSQRARLGRTVLSAQECGVPELGCIVEYGVLYGALAGALARAGIPVLYDAQARRVTSTLESATVHYVHAGRPGVVYAALLVVADGGKGLTEIPGIRRDVQDYGQAALVAQVETELPHHHVAYERFTTRGPVALLPHGERTYALVWTETPEIAQALCELDETDFLRRLYDHFGDRQGAFLAVRDRGVFPLRLACARPVTGRRLAVIGNAAQTLHPVAGQGFNLGLRDAWELARLIGEIRREQLGSPAMLQRYRARRCLDREGGILFTDFLVRVFSNGLPGLGALRGHGLNLLETCLPAKRFVADKMMFGARG
ncbi:MAG: FAD-dependent monooxygenase [Methylophilaceae bacterium]|nr:FAD-dependent monooxygenase [Methylophilaceae bacterium]